MSTKVSLFETAPVIAYRFAVAFANMVDEYTARVQRGQVRRTLQTLSTDHFGEKWVRDALQLTEGAAQSGTVGIEPEIGGLEQPACSRERFVLLTLIELGVLNHHQDVAPLLKVVQNELSTLSNTN